MHEADASTLSYSHRNTAVGFFLKEVSGGGDSREATENEGERAEKQKSGRAKRRAERLYTIVP